MRKLFVYTICMMWLVGCTNVHTDHSKKQDNMEKQMTGTDQMTEKDQKDTKQPHSYNEPESKNILLVGVDSRGEERSNSDSIMIARYDRNDKSIKLASIMRDSYVKIPNYSKKYNKINHAYLLGGTDLLKETINSNFGIEVDSVAVIDFQGFINVIDLIAPEGIEVDVTSAMINDMKLQTKPGKQKLLAEDLLKYVRFRHDDQSDFGRVKRQQEVLISLKDEVFTQFSKLDGIVKFPKLFHEVVNNVKTDLSFDEIAGIATSLVLNPVKDVKTLRIPIENSFENKSIRHAGAVLQIDFQENIEALEHFFNEEEMVDKAG